MGKEECEVQGVDVEPLPTIARPVVVRALSPITIYRTLYTAEGKRKTYYFHAFESEWEELLLANLRRKAMALRWSNRQLANLEGAHIRPLRVGKNDGCIVKYKGTVIKGWTGLFALDLPEPFFFLAYDSGLGAKNSQGFGMVEVVDVPKA